MRDTMDRVYNLFEYSIPQGYDGDIEELDAFLTEIWHNREKSDFSWWKGIDDDITQEEQRFIKLSRKHGTIRANKYVGVIRFKGITINLLPKIFDNGQSTPHSDTDIEAIQGHILWWLSYCSKFRFPKSRSSYGGVKSDFFEVLIYIFASYTRRVLSNMIHQNYEEVQNELEYMKGRLDVNGYIRDNVVSGNWQRLNCIYDSFEVDNNFNRIIKYVSRLLLNYSASRDSRKYLREILFMLDEVSDQRVTLLDCQRVKLNPLLKDMYPILDYCKLFLGNSTVLSYKDQFDVFAFLLPMEYIFEDFIYGFINQEIDVKVRKQVGNRYLTTDKIFQLKPDLVIESKGERIIADTKYKKIYKNDSCDKKRGISQQDMYQMLAYAVRNKVRYIKLLYPATVMDSEDEKNVHFEIKDEFADDGVITIDAFKLPIIAENWRELDLSQGLQKGFDKVTISLKENLRRIIGS